MAGFGFLALAVMIFGQLEAADASRVASLLFGLFKCIAAAYTSLDINGDGVSSCSLQYPGISAHFYQMLPYLITMHRARLYVQELPRPQGRGHPLR